MAKRDPRTDPRVDAYIAKAKPFAQPILKQLRATIHAASPKIVETIKWGSPSYEYEGILCGFAAFKEHCIFGFWKHTLVVPNADKSDGSGGSIGRIRTVKELPSKAVLTAWIKKAMKLNEAGVKAPHMTDRKKRKPLAMPTDLKSAISRDAKAKSCWDAFSPSAQRDYIEWITEAKAAATREKRLLTAVEWIGEGKRRNWKYER
jgi:uncharacterized protein YdeI (YjbR/CyaY-like superfamily)